MNHTILMFDGELISAEALIRADGIYSAETHAIRCCHLWVRAPDRRIEDAATLKGCLQLSHSRRLQSS
jgi:hypothetical protein